MPFYSSKFPFFCSSRQCPLILDYSLGFPIVRYPPICQNFDKSHIIKISLTKMLNPVKKNHKSDIFTWIYPQQITCIYWFSILPQICYLLTRPIPILLVDWPPQLGEVGHGATSQETLDGVHKGLSNIKFGFLKFDFV